MFSIQMISMVDINEYNLLTGMGWTRQSYKSPVFERIKPQLQLLVDIQAPCLILYQPICCNDPCGSSNPLRHQTKGPQIYLCYTAVLTLERIVVG